MFTQVQYFNEKPYPDAYSGICSKGDDNRLFYLKGRNTVTTISMLLN
jgi:hypothetical protein